MSNLGPEIKEFVKRYYGKILGESKSVVLAKPIANPRDILGCDNPMAAEVRYQAEPLITIDLPLSELTHLVNMERIFFNNSNDSKTRRIFNQWYDNEKHEESLRQTNESVRLAYEHYRALMLWAKDPGKKPLDIS